MFLLLLQHVSKAVFLESTAKATAVIEWNPAETNRNGLKIKSRNSCKLRLLATDFECFQVVSTPLGMPKRGLEPPPGVTPTRT